MKQTLKVPSYKYENIKYLTYTKIFLIQTEQKDKTKKTVPDVGARIFITRKHSSFKTLYNIKMGTLRKTHLNIENNSTSLFFTFNVKC